VNGRAAAKQIFTGRRSPPQSGNAGDFDMTRTIALFAALAAATATFPAYAQAAGQSTEVRYADLNLASSTGAQALKDRVARAAKRVCTSDGEKSLSGAAEARRCADIALAKAMPQVELALANAGTQVAENSRLSVAAH
jgi:UrcA family protein